MGHAQMYPKAKEISESLSLRSQRGLVKGKHCAFPSTEGVQGIIYQLASRPGRCQSKC